MKIFITNWHRTHFLDRVLENIRTRTVEPFITVYDNGSDGWEQGLLRSWATMGRIDDLRLGVNNVGTTFPKRVFHSIAKMAGDEFYVVTDNDFITSVDWLPRMLKLMRARPDLALLTPQFYPQFPIIEESDEEVTYCRIVGNTFKLIRTEAVDKFFTDPSREFPTYNDDGALAHYLQGTEWRSAFCKNIFCYNLELGTPSWGYANGQEGQDPRRGPDYPAHPAYQPLDWETLRIPLNLIS